ncbi:MAG: DUF2207 domain-containing protein [Cumulibacter sp.]
MSSPALMSSTTPTHARALALCSHVIACAIAIAALIVFSWPPAAHAETGDRITSYDIQYVVDADGSVHVTETIDYQFASYGRHGIFRWLQYQGAAGEEQDRLYDISDFSVSSPTGASTRTQLEQQVGEDGRSRYDVYQIGSSSDIVDESETYVLTYTIDGALNPQDGQDTEFYWNATGHEWDAAIDQVTISVDVPDGPTQVACWAGPAGTSDPCDDASIEGGTAIFEHTSSSYGSNWGVTIAVGINADAVEAAPVFVDRPTWANQNGFTPLPMTLGAVVLIGLSAFGWRLRLSSRDRRFANVPPGVIPDNPGTRVVGIGSGAKVIADDLAIKPPVAFSPPRGISPAQASYLRRPGHDPDQLAATILDLAHRGVLRIVGDEYGDSRRVELQSRGRLEHPHEQAFVDNLFAGGTSVSLTKDVPPGVTPPLHRPNDRLRAALASDVKRRKWFVAELGGARKSLRALGWLLAIGGIALLLYTAYQFETESTGSGFGIWGLVALLAGPILIWMSKRGRGQGRTAMGRAVMDQVDGFETYLRTAEADQLRFEEGEDIFSKYLPWAVAFDVTERWSRICADLSARGLIPAQPAWYSGRWDGLHTYLWVSSFNHHINSAASAPVPTPSTLGSSGGFSGGGFGGFSGGSGFGGGGFSGGGGGGGGGGSW